MEPDHVSYNISEFQRTGCPGALNYYRAADPYFHLCGDYPGATITQPCLYLWGKDDGLSELYPPMEILAANLPGLVGSLQLNNVGHWVQHEASAEVSVQLLKFLGTVSPV